MMLPAPTPPDASRALHDALSLVAAIDLTIYELTNAVRVMESELRNAETMQGDEAFDRFLAALRDLVVQGRAAVDAQLPELQRQQAEARAFVLTLQGLGAPLH
jgi:hypothetical protein